MNISNVILTFKTYKNPLWFYAVCMKRVKGNLAMLKLRNGLRFFVRVQNTDWFVIHEVFARHVYDEALRGLNPQESIVVDIGGFIGDFSILAATKAKHVYSYEPEKENYSLLTKNIQENNIHNITPRNFGIAEKNATFSLYVSDTHSSCNTMYPELLQNAVATQSISCVTLAQECKKYNITRIDLLKIDCEGAEYDILMSIPSSILRFIKKIIFEYQDQPAQQKYHKTLLEHLKNNGFSIKKLEEMNSQTGTILAYKN